MEVIVPVIVIVPVKVLLVKVLPVASTAACAVPRIIMPAGLVDIGDVRLVLKLEA